MGWLRKWSWIFAVVTIVCLILYVFPWQYDVDSRIQGVQFRIGDEGYSEKVSVAIKGEYKRYLFKNDTFEGTISIDRYPYTLEEPIIQAVFIDGYASITYAGVKDGDPDMHMLGVLCCTPDFRKLLIGISEPLNADSGSWSTKNGLVICAPAESRAEALKNAKLLSRKSKLLSKVNWK